MLTERQRQKLQAGEEFAAEALCLNEGTPGNNFQILWQRCCEHGLAGLPVPQQYGGGGEDVMNIVALMEGIGRGCRQNGLMFALNTHIWACAMPLVLFGNPQQQHRWLPVLASGSSIGAHAISEPQGGSDIFGLTTTYRREERAFVLNGLKAFVTNGERANIILVFARREGTGIMKGISCFVVERSAPGLTVGEPMAKMGLEMASLCSLKLDECRLPEENLLGEEGQGPATFNTIMAYERPFLLAFQIGGMHRQLQSCVNYARRRKHSSGRIIKFQSVSNRLADMKVRLEASRLLVYEAARQIEQGGDTVLSSSVAKLFVSESLVENSMSAMRTLGGYGYLKEYEAESQLRDSVASLFYSGTSDVLRNVIVSQM